MMSIVGAWGQTETFEFTVDTYNGYTNGTTYNLYFKDRTFPANEWQAVCFPFDIKKSTLDAVFTGGYELREFSSMNGNNFVFTELILTDESVIKAGTPFVLKSTLEVSGPTFNNVIMNDNAKSITYDDKHYFQGTILRKYQHDLNASGTRSAWLLTSSGNIETLTYKDGGYGTTMAYFYVTDKETQSGIEGITSSESGSGEGGGGTTPTYTDISGTIKLGLQEKITNREQLTDVPTIYLDIPDVSTINNDLVKVIDPETGDTKYFKATIQVVDNSEVGSPQHLNSFIETELEVKVRGNSTANPGNGKRPYRLKFAKKHKHDLLGHGYEKRNWTLLANAFDGSLIRNAVTYHLGKYVGMPFCPGYKFVDLVINGDYRGTYQVSDQVEVDNDRININEDTDWFVEAVTWENQAEEPYTKGGQPYFCIKNPEPETTEETEALVSSVEEWRTKWLAAFDSVDPATGWQSMNDVESFIKYYIATNITGDYDGWFVFKGYRTPTGPFFWGPLWDKDLAYGNWADADASKLVEYYQKCNFELKIQGLLNQRAFVEKAKQCIDKLIDDGLYNNLAADIDRIASSINQTQALNYQLYSISSIPTGSIQKTTYEEYVKQLKDFIKDRITTVQSELQKKINALPAPTESTYNPENPWWGTGLVQNKEYNLDISNRTLKGGQWNTFCLPFAASQTQMESALGCEYELKVHSGVDGNTMLFSSPESLDIQAGVPYLIKPVADVNTFSKFNNVFYTANVTNSTTNPFNGIGVTYDDIHYFYASLFHGYELSKETDYIFNNDVYTNDASFVKTNSIDQNGCRAFVRVTDGSTPTISFISNVEPVVRTQLTTLPTIYIDTQDKAEVQSSAGEWVAAGIQVIDAKGNLKPFTQEIGLTSAGKNILQIRGRGTTSWTNTDKKSYRLQFGKDEKDDLGNVTKSYKHNLLENEDGAGVVKKRNWVLLANSGDKTLVRNALTKEIGAEVGLPFTPGYRFVDLVLNGTYVGTYQVTEFLEADANRVNIDEDKGLLIQMTGRTDADLTNDHVISGEDYSKPYLTIKNPEVKKNQDTWNEAFNRDVYDFDGMWKANDGTGLNKKSLVNWYIASEIIGDYEALSSIYAYKDKNATELSFGPLWGTETAYDNNASITMTSTGLMSDENEDTHNGLMTKAGKQSAWQTKIEGLWAQPWFANAVRLRWNTLYNNGALTTTLKNKVTTLAGIVNATDETFTTSSQAKNFTATADGGAGWTIEGQGITSYSKNVANNATYETEIARLKAYIETRLPYLDKKFKAMDNTVEYDVTRSDAISAYSIYNGQTANVILKNRGTIWGNEWNAICLPFSLTDGQLTAVFGEGYELKSFKSVTEGDTYNTFNFNDAVNELSAGVPYIIKPTADVTNLTFNNVTLNLSLDKSVVEATSDKSNTFKFTGTLQPYKMADDGTDWFIGRSNKAYMSNGTMHACRAYFTMPSVSAAAKKFSFDFDDITGVEHVFIGDTVVGNVKIYNLNGQVVGTNLDALPNGIYVVNGKKIIK